MRRLSIKHKLTLIVGFIATITATIANLFIVQMVFHSIESQIKNDLSNHYLDVKALAEPAKSVELASYLRSNDLSLFIFDENRNVIARYGIYRSIDEETLGEFVDLPTYIDKDISNFGEYDIYTKDNIQIAVKNNLLPILKRSFYLSLLILLPIVWIVSSLVAAFATNVVLSPLLKAKNISHELKNPLARVASSLQLIHDEAPASLKKLIKESANELIQLGGNVDSILSLSLLRKNNGDQDKYTNVKRELDKFKTTIPNNLKLTVKVSKNLIIPLDMNLANIIFRNLIDNAVKYNDKDGYININALKKGKNWTFTIKNSVSKKPTKTGYGLGMTIVKDICHNHDIEFNSFSTENYFLIELRGNLSKQNAANGSIPLHSRQHFFRY